MPNNAQLELNAVHQLMLGKNPELLVKIESDMFGNDDIKSLFNLIKRFYVEKGTWIGWDVLNGIVTKAARSQERADYLLKLILKIRDRETEGLSDDDILQELTDFKNLRTVMDVSEELIQAVEQKDAAKVTALYKKGYEKICLSGTVEEESDLGRMSGEDIEYIFRKTGFSDIDSRSGFAEGDLVLLGGESGAGKSTLAHCIGMHNYKNYTGSIAYWSYEQGKKAIMSRIWSRESQLDLGKLISNTISLEERTVLRRTKADFLMNDVTGIECVLDEFKSKSEQQFMDKLYSLYEPRNNKFLIYDDCLDFDALLMKMEFLYAVKGVRIFIVDYITLIPRGKLESKLAQWEYNLYKSQMLKTFARKHGDCIVITPVQYDSTEDKIKLASNMKNDSDVFIAMSQSEEDKKCGAVNCAYKKYRNFTGDPLKDFKLIQEFDKAGFIDFGQY